MTNVCRNRDCHRPTTLFLCEDCQTQLRNMLSETPWLITQLEDRAQKLDRISAGTVGRTRRPDELDVMDFDAAQLLRTTRKTLLRWVTQVAQQHTGRTPPALDTTATQHLAAWLHQNVPAITRLALAGDLYRDIDRLTGVDQKGGDLVHAINRNDRVFAGPCPTTRTHDRQGRPVPCGRMLWADGDDTTVTCPTCHTDIDVRRNRVQAHVDRDLLPEPKLLEVLDDLDEHVSRVKLYEWIKAGRLKRRGWIHGDRIVQFKIRRGDPAVFSLSQARVLRSST